MGLVKPAQRPTNWAGRREICLDPGAEALAGAYARKSLNITIIQDRESSSERGRRETDPGHLPDRDFFYLENTFLPVHKFFNLPGVIFPFFSTQLLTA